MAELTRRLQVLLDDERYRRLERQAERRGSSVAALVREVIDLAFPGEWPDRQRAGDRLLAADPVDVGDWVAIKRDLEADLYGRPAT